MCTDVALNAHLADLNDAYLAEENDLAEMIGFACGVHGSNCTTISGERWQRIAHQGWQIATRHGIVVAECEDAEEYAYRVADAIKARVIAAPTAG